MENTKNLRKNIIQSLSSCLDESWLIRRIIQSKGKYYIEEIGGRAVSSIYDRANIELSRFTHTDGMSHEALVLVHKRTAGRDADSKSFSDIIRKYTDVIRTSSSEYVSHIGLISSELGLEATLGQRDRPCPDWAGLLKDMPSIASLLSSSAHLLFVGSKLTELVNMSDYSEVVESKEIAGIYDSLAQIRSIQIPGCIGTDREYHIDL